MTDTTVGVALLEQSPHELEPLLGYRLGRFAQTNSGICILRANVEKPPYCRNATHLSPPRANHLQCCTSCHKMYGIKFVRSSTFDFSALLVAVLRELRWDSTDDLILGEDERSCYSGGGGDVVTIGEAGTLLTDGFFGTDGYFEEVISFSNFNWATRTTEYLRGLTVADSRSTTSSVRALAVTSCVMLSLGVVVPLLVMGGLIFAPVAARKRVGRFQTRHWVGCWRGGPDQNVHLHLLGITTALLQLALLCGNAGAALTALAILVFAWVVGALFLAYLGLYVQR